MVKADPKQCGLHDTRLSAGLHIMGGCALWSFEVGWAF